jgi:SMI1 / KNR4 family (SUKH-1)
MDEIEKLEAELGVPLPAEFRALLEQGPVAEEDTLEIDLTGRSFSVGLEELFPAGLPIAADGFGNFWLLDLTPDAAWPVPVFFLCHDPPVVLYQSADLDAFLRDASQTSPLDERFVFADLRSPSAGDGFSWGRYGPRTELRRHGFDRLFAVAPSGREPRSLRRLLHVSDR